MTAPLSSFPASPEGDADARDARSVPAKTYLTLAEAAARTYYTRSHLRVLAVRGKVSSRRQRRRWYVAVEDIRAYIESKPQKRARRPRHAAR